MSIDLLGLRSVVRIGKKFMFGCRSLKSIDFTPLTKLTSLPITTTTSSRGFLGGCSSLSSVNLKGMVWLDVVRELGEDEAAVHILQSTSAPWVSDEEDD